MTNMTEKRTLAEAQTTVIITRHTDVQNPGGIYYGRIPGYGLSDLGREQAERTAGVLARESLAALYTSPMLRARQTARVLAARHAEIKPRVTWLLAEVRSAWQGRTFDELDKIGYDFYSQPLAANDEALEAVWRRVQRFVQMVRERHPGRTVAGVSHGDLCMITRAGYAGLPIVVASIRRPHVYAGKGSLTRLHFSADLRETYPLSVEYYDPNGDNPKLSSGWVRVGPGARFDL